MAQRRARHHFHLAEPRKKNGSSKSPRPRVKKERPKSLLLEMKKREHYSPPEALDENPTTTTVPAAAMRVERGEVGPIPIEFVGKKEEAEMWKELTESGLSDAEAKAAIRESKRVEALMKQGLSREQATLIFQIETENPLWRGEYEVRDILKDGDYALQINMRGPTAVNVRIVYDPASDTYSIKAYRIHHRSLKVEEIYDGSPLPEDLDDTLRTVVKRSLDPTLEKDLTAGLREEEGKK
ncbi:MAG: hypothetical protein ACHQ03_11655 [Candidatus Bathyarchaeia archaeon]